MQCNWYEHGEKSPKFFISLQISLAVQNQIWNISIGNIEVNNQKDINNEPYLYYKNLFTERKHLSESEHNINNILNGVSKFPQFSTEQSLKCEKCITEKDLFEAWRNMPNEKSPGNDSLTKNFSKHFGLR